MAGRLSKGNESAVEVTALAIFITLLFVDGRIAKPDDEMPQRARIFTRPPTSSTTLNVRKFVFLISPPLAGTLPKARHERLTGDLHCGSGHRTCRFLPIVLPLDCG